MKFEVVAWNIHIAEHWIGACISPSVLEHDTNNNCSAVGARLTQPQELGTCHLWNWNLSDDQPIADPGISQWRVPVVAGNATVSDINLSVFGEHEYLSDIEVKLISPQGTPVTLFSRQCSARVGKFNIDDSPVQPASVGVHSIPAVLIFRDGQVVEQLVGVHPIEDYRAALARAGVSTGNSTVV